MQKCSKAVEVYVALYNFILAEGSDDDNVENLHDPIDPPTNHLDSEKEATCDKIMEKYYQQ